MHNGFLEPEADEVFHDGKNGYDGLELKLDDIASPFGPSSIREFTFFNYEEIFGPIHIQKKSKIPVLSPNQSPTSPGDEDDLMSPYLYGTPGPASPRSRRRVKKCKSFPFALWEISPGPVWVALSLYLRVCRHLADFKREACQKGNFRHKFLGLTCLPKI